MNSLPTTMLPEQFRDAVAREHMSRNASLTRRKAEARAEQEWGIYSAAIQTFYLLGIRPQERVLTLQTLGSIALAQYRSHVLTKELGRLLEHANRQD